MSKIKLKDGTSYPIDDYATPNDFVIFLDSTTIEDVMNALTEENLSEIQFIADSGAVTGMYYNQLMREHRINGNMLAVNIDDADLCRYGLVLDSDKRIVTAEVQRFSNTNAIIIDKLPDGMPTDYLYIDGEYVYSPLPTPEQTDPMERIAALEEQIEMLLSGVTSDE